MVIHGNNIEKLKDFPDNYFDSIVTDPPYGLGKEPNAVELMKDWVEKGYHEISGAGFMGKEWDAFVPQPIFWKEVFRVLKHGGYVVSFFGTRTYDWGVMSMRFAGFEVRDCIQWLYGSGFPKSHNVSKAIDKMNGAERKEEAKKWDGWGSALKPANEPIVLARKPLEKGLSIAENVLKWGTGAINIDGCRVGFKNEADYKESTEKNQHEKFGTKPMTNNNVYGDYSMVQPKNYQPEGRFPANIILTHHPDCECKGLKKVKSHNPDNKEKNVGFNPKGENLYGKGNGITNNAGYSINGEETVEHWECVDDCPIKIMDEQSGERKSNGLYKKDGDWQNQGDGKIRTWDVGYDKLNKYAGDTGGASRFFYVAKASKSERNRGLDGFEAKQMAWSNQAKAELKRGNTEFSDDTKMHNKVQLRVNFHPTVKPVKLMQYLVRMVTQPNGKVLDPFCGSGTTGIACKLEGFDFVGIEQDAEYAKISESRIENYTEEPEEKLEIIEDDENGKITQLSMF